VAGRVDNYGYLVLVAHDIPIVIRFPTTSLISMDGRIYKRGGYCQKMAVIAMPCTWDRWADPIDLQ
jgi:hypothetical protein